jgi:hypothetical protein
MTAHSFSRDFNATMKDTFEHKAEEVVRSKLEEAFCGKKPAAPTELVAPAMPAMPGASPAAPAAAAGKADTPKSGRDAATDVLRGIFGR